MSVTEHLPEWATEHPDKAGVIVIDADQAYPALLGEYRKLADGLPEQFTDAYGDEDDGEGDETAPIPIPDTPHVAELRKLDPVKPDQYWLEVVYQSAKFDVHRAFVLAGVKAWAPNLVEIRIRGDKRTWAQKLFPEGRGIWHATKGKEARRLYVMLRGFLPN